MGEIIPHSSATTAIARPLPQVGVTIRPGVLSDVPFLDSLQKLHTKRVGWMPTAQFEGKIKLGHVLIAEEEAVASCQLLVASKDGEREASLAPSSLTTSNQQLVTPRPVGYCIGTDQYFKRDDVGVIYQMNVVPGKQRSLVGATLLKAMFDRAAYGCRLFCCWCTQDIAANRFWEAMGFVPLAFRAGSASKSRVHIFWQRRIRAGDVTTPWWFPSQTSSGSIREERLVRPIPPGTHWSDAKPMILPGAEGVEEPKRLHGQRKPNELKSSKAVPVQKHSAITSGGLRFASPVPPESETVKPKRAPKRKVKNDPRLVAAARELRDRWLEQVNSDRFVLEGQGKYDVSRQLGGAATIAKETPLLAA